MPTKPPAKTQRDFQHTWFVQEWMTQAGKIQADLSKELDWSKGKANAVWNGQQYTQEMIDRLAPWLNARPFELLMHPDDAMALRRLREDVIRIAASAQPAEPPVAANRRRAG